MHLARKVFFVLMSLLCVVSLVTAQEDCPATVEDAVSVLSDVCLNVGRNEACYGNGSIVAVPQSDATFTFANPGDVAPVDDIASLSLSPFGSALDNWGIAVLVLQASLPDSLPGQNVTMLLFGDTNLTNEGNAFYFNSGIGTPDCNQAPNGMLIQTPDGAGEVNLTLNGIDITIGSTAYLGTLEEDILTFALLEGNSSLSIEGSDVTLETEQFTTIELDEDGNATGEFTEPAPIEDLDLPELPSTLLPGSIDGEGDSDAVAVPDEAVLPLSGSWLFTIGEITLDGNCPAMLDEQSIREGLSTFGYGDSVVQELTFDDVVDIENFFGLENFDMAGLSYTVDESATNIFVVTVTIPDAGSFSYTWRIISETYVEAEIDQHLVIPDFADCNINTSVSIEHQG